MSIMRKIVFSLACVILVQYVVVSAAADWWETAAFYQIYPRSFKDSDGDGIGDLNGITSKLEYLKNDLGVTAFWLSPIYKSPMADFGYDISDFREIQPEYGTMEDFETLVATAKELGLRVILDFVPNHSSDEHEWFQKSLANDSTYADFYIWHPGKLDPTDNETMLPPSNWVAAFTGSAWEWSANRSAYYLHQFHKKQPDLNYRNPLVVEAMKDVLRFWLNKGIDGFRVDAVPWLFETQVNAEGYYDDEPWAGTTNDTESVDYVLHIYTQDQNETVDMVYQWRTVMDSFQVSNGGDTRILMTESWSALSVVETYFQNADGTRQGSQMPFNFQVILNVKNDSTAEDYNQVITDWTAIVPTDHASNWVLGNHDQRRVGSRMGTDRIDTMNMISLSLPGASVTYQGEEIGMTDVLISWEDTRDPQACNTNSSVYESKSRDPARTPFQWDNSTSAGFSTNSTTWLPIDEANYLTINVAYEEALTNSHLKVYQGLIRLRKTDTFMEGSLIRNVYETNVLVITRYLSGSTIYVIVANLGDDTNYINITNSVVSGTLYYELVSTLSSNIEGDSVSASNVTVLPKESFILRSVENTTTTTASPVTVSTTTTTASTATASTTTASTATASTTTASTTTASTTTASTSNTTTTSTTAKPSSANQLNSQSTIITILVSCFFIIYGCGFELY